MSDWSNLTFKSNTEMCHDINNLDHLVDEREIKFNIT